MQRQILPRVSKIWAGTLQNLASERDDVARAILSIAAFYFCPSR